MLMIQVREYTINASQIVVITRSMKEIVIVLVTGKEVRLSDPDGEQFIKELRSHDKLVRFVDIKIAPQR